MKNKKEFTYDRLRDAIEAYFDICDMNNSESKKTVKPYTLSGLLSHIGLSRQEFEELSSRKHHARLVAYAKARIEAFIEEKALTGELSCNASLNSLKYNFGWGEKQRDDEQKQNSNITVTLSPEMYAIAK